ncbi:MAG: 1-acyl-sn-glycerol-3-phosphate acyltransferase [Pseudonocardiales bacterium]|nr:1-acyl-sn-glycerol-3-phosphate acyltransferase [Jatrophihabitantaceae bacterium]MCW2603351.1 1-acyl-sn-glycerol-3-phosphate acyltransferase [Pseudonocardiales bacterium]
MLYWFLKWVGLGPIMKLLWRPRVEGASSLPAAGPVIIASNHLSFIDSFFLPLMVRRRVTFLAKAEYFTKPGFAGWLSKRFFVGTGQVPIDRAGADAAKAALDTGLRVLTEGSMLGIYPEGTRSPDGKLYRGKTGVARLALASGAVVVPCAVINTDKLQPPGRLLPKLRPRPRLRFGAPLDFSGRTAEAGDRESERAVTNQIVEAIRLLSGQEYVDEYAADVKAKRGGPRAFGSS